MDTYCVDGGTNDHTYHLISYYTTGLLISESIVKEMSEVVIVKSLKKAVEAWVKARDTTGF